MVTLYHSGWPRIHYEDQAGLELTGISLPLSLKCWDCRNALPHPAVSIQPWLWSFYSFSLKAPCGIGAASSQSYDEPGMACRLQKGVPGTDHKHGVSTCITPVCYSQVWFSARSDSGQGERLPTICGIDYCLNLRCPHIQNDHSLFFLDLFLCAMCVGRQCWCLRKSEEGIRVAVSCPRWLLGSKIQVLCKSRKRSSLPDRLSSTLRC